MKQVHSSLVGSLQLEMLSSLEFQGCNTPDFYLSHRIVGREGEFENLKKKSLLLVFLLKLLQKSPLALVGFLESLPLV